MTTVARATTWETILSLSVVERLRNIETPKQLWYDLEHCAILVDMSYYQGDIAWHILRELVDGAIVRMGYAAILDKKWPLNKAYLRGLAEKIRGTYWYYSTGASWRQQSDLILEELEYFSPGDLEIFALDIEAAYNHQGNTFRNDPLKILAEVTYERPDINVWFYTNVSVWEDWLRANVAYLEYLMWLAWYPWDRQKTTKPYLPKNVSHENIVLWQDWTDGNNLGSKYGVQSVSLDMNRTRDTREEVFADLLHAGSPVTQPQPQPYPWPVVIESPEYRVIVEKV